MPRIDAPSIAEHVAAREADIIAAAIRLFGERGVNDVSIGDIADDVGLARTSLYRYFPTKSAIIHTWFEAAMEPILAECVAIADDDRPAVQRLERWVDLQLSLLADPSNHAMIAAALDTDDIADDQHDSIAAQHQALYTTLERILADGGPVDDDVRAETLVIAGLLRTVTDLIQHGFTPAQARRRIRNAIVAVSSLSTVAAPST